MRHEYPIKSPVHGSEPHPGNHHVHDRRVQNRAIYGDRARADRSRPTIAQGILGGLKSIIGGQIGAYTQMCEQTREQAYELLVQHAHEVGANAVVGFRYDASEIGGKAVSATEVLCYGTAVVIEKA